MTGSFLSRILIQDFAFPVNHIERDFGIAQGKQGEAGIVATEPGSVDRLDLSRQGTCTVHDIIHIASQRFYMLEIMDMPAQVHIDVVLVEQRLDMFAHIGALAFRLGRISGW